MDLRHLRPQMWSRLYPTSYLWDSAVRAAIDAVQCGAPLIVEDHTATLAGLEVWIGNWPYAFGRPYDRRGGAIDVMPTRRTAVLLRDIVNGHCAKRERDRLRAFIARAEKGGR